MFSVDEASVAEHAFHLGGGVAALVIAVWGASAGIPGIIFVSVPFGVIAGILLAPYIIAPATRAAGGLFWPSGKRLKIRRQFSEIRNKINGHDYSEAIEDLQDTIAEHPDWYDAYLLLAELYGDTLDDPEEALAAAEAGLGGGGQYDESQQKLVMIAVDCLLELRRRDEALTRLKQAIERIPNAGLQQYRDRLEALTQ